MGALLRGRESAEVPRRAADGAVRAMLPAGGQAGQPLWEAAPGDVHPVELHGGCAMRDGAGWAWLAVGGRLVVWLAGLTQ